MAECKRAYGEHEAIASEISGDHITVYTDGSRLEPDKGEEVGPFNWPYQSCGAGWVVYESARKIHSGGKYFGDHDVNVGEIGAIESVLTWLKDSGKHDGDKRREVHIFTDSDLTYNWLTEPGCHTKYYRAVQRTRRLAARLPKYQFILHWIPSHLSKHFEEAKEELEIPGNAAADVEAGNAACDGRAQQYVHPDKGLASWDIQRSIMREAAWLVHKIGHLFPPNTDPDPVPDIQSSPTTDPTVMHSVCVCAPCEESSSVTTASEI